MDKLFYTASDEEIKKGETTDIYFIRAKQILRAKKMDEVKVTVEVTPSNLPDNWSWGILCGVEEVARLFEGLPVNVYSFPEGSIFFVSDKFGVREPVMVIEGSYGDFCVFETPLLGFLCQASGIATKAARIRKLVWDKLLVSFGVRRMHPAIAPMIDRAAYIGGFNEISCLLSAKMVGKQPVGTMPHSLIIIFGEQSEAWKAFDEVVGPEIPRIALIDTYFDEKTEAIKAVETLGKKLHGVRLDTPSSRRGDFPEIIREVRWELNIRGYENVKIMVSGGLNEDNIKLLADAGADAFGVGTSISSTRVVDFASDIVNIEGKPVAKRGKFGGKKQVWRCHSCMLDVVLTYEKPQPSCPSCNSRMEQMLKPLIRGGKLIAELPSAKKIREHVVSQLEKIKV